MKSSIKNHIINRLAAILGSEAPIDLLVDAERKLNNAVPALSYEHGIMKEG